MSKANGTLFVITGPSGAGKGTVLSKVFDEMPGLNYSVSATTRKPRAGEKDGVDYHYISKEAFESMIEENMLLEYTRYAGNYYGTPKEPVDKCLEHGEDVLLEIELDGAMNIRKLYSDAVLIFLSPPSLDELERRLRARGTEDESHIKMRLEKARAECEASGSFDHIVINDVVSDAANKIKKIIYDKRNQEE